MPDWGQIGEQVFDRTYSRTKDDGTKETFDEVVERMVRGNTALVDPRSLEGDETDRLKTYTRKLAFVPGGRHWWVSGVPGRQFWFNCHRAGWTDQLADHVGFVFDELMKGGGIGANYSTSYMNRMHRVRRKIWIDYTPKPWASLLFGGHADDKALSDVIIQKVDEHVVTHETVHVPDSREGWVHAMSHLCRVAQLEGPDVKITFDVTDVRPHGSPIRGFGGTASGPAPLIRALSEVSETLRQAVGHRLTPIQGMEIDHSIASCVIAGNVRRSARMSMVHWADPHAMDFIRLKRDGGHWTTNISVETDDDFWDRVGKDDYVDVMLDEIVAGMLTNGEPGLYNSSVASRGERGDVRCTNPCGEIALEEWENCNLGHVNLAADINPNQVNECLRLMARWLVRATFADGMTWRQAEVVARNRRIGVGFMGLQPWLHREFGIKYSELARHAGAQRRLHEMQAIVRQAADEYADQLDIPRPIKVTTVAPTGTVAKMAGATEGLAACWSKYFIRRVRYDVSDTQVEVARDQGLHVESDLNNPNTMVVSYPCRDRVVDQMPEDMVEQQSDLTVFQMLGVQQAVQTHWADNAISFTVNTRPDLDPEYLKAALTHYGRTLKGTTLNPDGAWAQAPMERITREQYEASGRGQAASSADDCEGACPIK